MFTRIFHHVVTNRPLLAAVLGWIVAQGFKVLGGVIRQRRFNFRWLIGTGGMPSAHSAGVSALTTAVGLTNGWDSPLFAVSLIFALVTMFDAQGVRRAAGQQARALNAILDDIYWKRSIAEGHVIQFLGHTPVEVFIGGALGILIGIFCVRG